MLNILSFIQARKICWILLCLFFTIRNKNIGFDMINSLEFLIVVEVLNFLDLEILIESLFHSLIIFFY